jgi:hypothetical protein
LRRARTALTALPSYGCFRARDHQILTNLGFMFLDEVLGEGMTGVVRDEKRNVLPWRGVTCDASGRVVDWHGLKVATYNKTTMCLEYRTPNTLVINAANARGVELVEISEQEWPATDENGVALDKTHKATQCGVSVVCTPNHELFVRTGRLGREHEPTTRALKACQQPDEFVKMTAQQLLLESEKQPRFAFRFMARAPLGIGRAAARAAFDVSVARRATALR